VAPFKDNQTPKRRYCFAAGVVVAVPHHTSRAHSRGCRPLVWWAGGCVGDGHTLSSAVMRLCVVVLGRFDQGKNSQSLAKHPQAKQALGARSGGQ